MGVTLFALAVGPSKRPAMLRDENGQAIEVEVWHLPIETLGSFLAGVPAPLGLGQVALADGSWKCGFICTAGALNKGGEAQDITYVWRLAGVAGKSPIAPIMRPVRKISHAHGP